MIGHDFVWLKDMDKSWSHNLNTWNVSNTQGYLNYANYLKLKLLDTSHIQNPRTRTLAEGAKFASGGGIAYKLFDYLNNKDANSPKNDNKTDEP
jgi:hypothetical protein